MPRWLILAALALTACGDSWSTSPAPTSSAPAPRRALATSDTSPGGKAQPAPTPVGLPLGPATSATIGADGGTLADPDGRVTVEVPAGAVAQPTAFSVQRIDNNADGGVGSAYRLLPHGTRFAKPVRLTFRYDSQEVRGTTPGLLRLAYQDDDGRWRMHRRVQLDTAQRTVGVETTHFSDWSTIAGARLLPQQATVAVGKTVELRVKRCEREEPDESAPDSLTSVPEPIFIPLLYDCEEDGIYTVFAKGWAVNGDAGGSDAAGTIVQRDRGVAVYTAPASVPRRNSNPVAVSVRYTGLEAGDEGLLVSNITVFDPGAACAHLANAVEWNATFGLSYAYAGTNRDGEQLSVRHAAEVTGRLRRVDPGFGDVGLPIKPMGVSWIGPVTGHVSVDDRHVRPRPSGDRVTTLVGSGAPVSKEPLDSYARVYLNVNLRDCTYNVGMVAWVQAVETTTGRAPVTGDAQVGAVRSDWRLTGGGKELTGGGAFTARSVMWGYMNADDVYFPSGQGTRIFFEGYEELMAGSAGTARVSWSLAPAKP